MVVFLFLNSLLSLVRLCKEVKQIYLCLHLGWKPPFLSIFHFLHLVSIPHSYYFSSLQPHKTISLAINDLTLFPHSYSILILSPHLLIFAALFLIWWWLLLHFFNFIPKYSLFLHFNSQFLLLLFPTPFCLPPALLFFILNFIPPQSGFYSLFLPFLLPLSSQTHFYFLQTSPNHFSSLFPFYSLSTFINFCLFVADIAAVVVFLQFCSYIFTIFKFLLKLILYSSPFILHFAFFTPFLFLHCKFSFLSFMAFFLLPSLTLPLPSQNHFSFS